MKTTACWLKPSDTHELWLMFIDRRRCIQLAVAAHAGSCQRMHRLANSFHRLIQARFRTLRAHRYNTKRLQALRTANADLGASDSDRRLTGV